MKFVVLLTVFIFAPLISILADLMVGQVYKVNFVDVDGNAFSTGDGRITVLVLTSTNDNAKAQLVGDRIPDFCVGNLAYRMVTLVNFQKKRFAATRAVLRALMRSRLDAAAKRLQGRYQSKGIERDARKDVSAVPDFDGAIVTQLGVAFSSDAFRVFVFGKNGELLREWNDVPRSEELAAALK